MSRWPCSDSCAAVSRCPAASPVETVAALIGHARDTHIFDGKDEGSVEEWLWHAIDAVARDRNVQLAPLYIERELQAATDRLPAQDRALIDGIPVAAQQLRRVNAAEAERAAQRPRRRGLRFAGR